MTIIIPSEDAVWIGGDLYCKTPEALTVALETIRRIGYSVQDNRVDGYSISRKETTPDQMEKNGWSIWFASLKGIRRGKCGSCQSLISTTGIESHGHVCEVCGEITYLKLTSESTIRFEFRGGERTGMFGPQLNMQVIRWDHEDGWLYVNPEPLTRGGLSVVHGERAERYLAEHSDKWELVDLEGVAALKIHYANSIYVQEDDVMNVVETWGPHRNFKIVKVWDGVEYDEYSRDFPIPDSISIYESWHWAPLSPSPTLHEKIIAAARQVFNADYYYQDGRRAWDPAHYKMMGVFVRHFTSLDADEWDHVSTRFPLDGPGGIRAVANFCHPFAEVRFEPNVGNFLTVFGDSASGRRVFNDREIMAAELALVADPLTQELAKELLRGYESDDEI